MAVSKKATRNRRRRSDSWRSWAVRMTVFAAALAILTTIAAGAMRFTHENTWDSELKIVADRVAANELVQQLQVGSLCDAKIEELIRLITNLRGLEELTDVEVRELEEKEKKLEYWQGVCRGSTRAPIR